MAKKTRVKSIVLIVLSAFSLAFGQSPVARNGILDLRDIDISENGPVELNGEWQFTWEKFIVDDKIPDDSISWIKVNIPGNWKGYSYRDNPIPPIGYGSYRLTVVCDRRYADLAFNITHIRTAYKFFLNGKELKEIGKIGKSENTSTPRLYPNIIRAKPDSDTLDIVIEVSNFDFRNGGISTSIIMGTVDDITNLRQDKLITAIFLFGAVLIISFYHIGLFILRRKDKSPLYFGIFALLFALRILVTGEYYFIHLFPNIRYEFILKLEYLTMYTAYPLFILFARSLFRKEFKDWFIKIIYAAFIAFPLLVILTPVRFNSHFVMPYQAFVGVTTLYSFIIILIAYIRKVEGSQYIIWGTVILFVCIFHDILAFNNIIHTKIIIQFGIFLFMFAQAFLLSSRSAHAFQKTEELSEELNRINVNLEKIVDEKTKALQDANVEIAQAYAKMRNQKDQLLDILHKPEMGFLLDKEGTVLGVTDRAIDISGISRSEWINQNLAAFIVDQSAQNLNALLRQVLIEGKSQSPLNLKAAQDTHISVNAVFTRLNQQNSKYILLIVFEADQL